jgi:hypothetical protein
MGVNIDLDALRARFRASSTGPGDNPARQAGHDDLETLIAALDEAHANVKRLTEQEDDLRESAELWIRLYNDALNRLETLRDAIAGVVTECEQCARHAHDTAAAPERTAAKCGLCLKALDALQSTADLVASKR